LVKSSTSSASTELKTFDASSIPRSKSVASPQTSFKYVPVPDFNDYIDVKLAVVNNSRNFYIHLDENEVKEFSENLNDFYQAIDKVDYPKFCPSEITSLQLYCAYDQEDNCFYRIRILTHAYLNHYWVLFVDYGKIKIVFSKFIYTLVAPFDSRSIIALSCFLNGILNHLFSNHQFIYLTF